MGREVRRVALDFKWPIGKVWEGFLNPHHPAKCPDCESGSSPTAELYHKKWYGYVPFSPEETGSTPFLPTNPTIMHLAERNYPNRPMKQRSEARRLADLFNGYRSHHLTQMEVDALWDDGRLRDFKEKPTAAQLNEWYLVGFGHDSINQWICCNAYCASLGVSAVCATCGGNAIDPADAVTYKLMEEWKETPPPAGDGWQLWETTTEGSPQTPVFKTPEELAKYCADSGVSTFGSDTMGYHSWLRFIRGPGWAPSMVGGGDNLRSGVEALAFPHGGGEGVCGLLE
jgi:hypothetical protein